MYSCANYATLDAHPPMIGYGIDGIPIFGRYLSSSAPGASEALDDCGGHQHSGMGTTASAFPFVADGAYHYHAFVQTIAADGDRQSYTAYTNGPYMCFKGNLSASGANLWLPSQPTASAAYGAGNLQTRADYVQVKPCSSMTSATAYLAKGYSLPGVTATGVFGAEGLTSTGAGSSGGACAAAAMAASSSTTPAASSAYVAATLALGGYSAATFGTSEAAAFRTAVAAKAGTTAASVTITALTDVAAGRRRVHAAATAVSITFNVASTSAQSAGVVSALSSLAVADFISAGLAATSATVTAPPTVMQTAVVAAGPPPPPAVQGASKSAAVTQTVSLLLAAAALVAHML